MKVSSVVLAFFFLTGLEASEAVDHARQLEKSGDVQGARTALAAAVQQTPNDIDALTGYAAFLMRYGDPDSRAAYAKAFDALERSGDGAKLAAVARELALLDLLAGDRAAAAKHIEAYHSARGKDWPNASAWKPVENAGENRQVK